MLAVLVALSEGVVSAAAIRSVPRGALEVYLKLKKIGAEVSRKGESLEGTWSGAIKKPPEEQGDKQKLHRFRIMLRDTNIPSPDFILSTLLCPSTNKLESLSRRLRKDPRAAVLATDRFDEIVNAIVETFPHGVEGRLFQGRERKHVGTEDFLKKLAATYAQAANDRKELPKQIKQEKDPARRAVLEKKLRHSEYLWSDIRTRRFIEAFADAFLRNRVMENDDEAEQLGKRYRNEGPPSLTDLRAKTPFPPQLEAFLRAAEELREQFHVRRSRSGNKAYMEKLLAKYVQAAKDRQQLPEQIRRERDPTKRVKLEKKLRNRNSRWWNIRGRDFPVSVANTLFSSEVVESGAMAKDLGKGYRKIGPPALDDLRKRVQFPPDLEAFLRVAEALWRQFEVPEQGAPSNLLTRSTIDQAFAPQ